ncbi:MAG TPA: isocitrate/isopropylmalate family dehydrogenase [Candidatus Acidoferrales bacterium]
MKTAPHIAGKGVANLTAILMSGTMMVEHTGESAAARRIEAALHSVYREGKHLTRDVGGTAGTKEFTEAVIGALKNDKPLLLPDEWITRFAKEAFFLTVRQQISAEIGGRRGQEQIIVTLPSESEIL